MSAIVFDHIQIDTEAPTARPAKGNRNCSRQEEFQSALDHYMAEYRKHRAMMIVNEDCRRRIAELDPISQLAIANPL